MSFSDVAAAACKAPVQALDAEETSAESTTQGNANKQGAKREKGPLGKRAIDSSSPSPVSDPRRKSAVDKPKAGTGVLTAEMRLQSTKRGTYAAPVGEIPSVTMRDVESDPQVHEKVLEMIRKKGVFVIKDVFSKDECKEAVKELLENTYVVPLDKKYKPPWRWQVESIYDSGKILDPENDEDMDELVEMFMLPMSPATIRYISARAVRDSTFGAPCTDPNFRCLSRLRLLEKKPLMKMFENIFGEDNTVVDINRTYGLYPGKGDTNIFKHVDMTKKEFENSIGKYNIKSLQGKLGFSGPTILTIVQESCTPEYREAVLECLAVVHPQWETAKLMKLDPEYDILEMQEDLRTYVAGPGNLVVWDSFCWHTHPHNDQDMVSMGAYIGVGTEEKMCKYQTKEMRQKWWETGLMPELYPSGQPTEAEMPKLYFSRSNLLRSYMEKMTEECKQQFMIPRLDENGRQRVGPESGKLLFTFRRDLHNNPNKPYTPPELTLAQRKYLKISPPAASAAGAAGGAKSTEEHDTIVISDDES